MRIKEAIMYGSEMIRENKKDESNYISKRLLCFLLKKDMIYLTIHNDEEISENTYNEFAKSIEKILVGTPIQYITNEQYFMGIKFYVDENVLIPQPDTEILVEEVINIINNQDKKKILDLCTGSGAIAVSLAKLTSAQIIGSDISKEAIEIATKNAKDNNQDIKFIQSDLFENIQEKFDIIVSNPPYIATNTIKLLEKEVQNEPFIALDGGEDGLVFYRRIIEKAKYYLNDDGYLALEIGFDQKESVYKILTENGYNQIYSKKDFGNNDRIIIAKSR